MTCGKDAKSRAVRKFSRSLCRRELQAFLPTSLLWEEGTGCSVPGNRRTHTIGPVDGSQGPQILHEAIMLQEAAFGNEASDHSRNLAQLV